MNLSAPMGTSFNEAVDTPDLFKLKMNSARLFGDALLKMGKQAVMSKFDIQDAYKLIKNHPLQRQLFGFKWLGMIPPWFLEVRQLLRSLTHSQKLW